MKRVLLTKKIDGFKIVLGSDYLGIEPIGTRKEVNKLLKDLKEFKDVGDKVKEIQQQLKAKHDSIQVAKEHKKNNDLAKYNKTMYEVEQRNEKIIVLNHELKGLLKTLKDKELEIWNKNLVYFEPGKNEKVISEKKYETYSDLVFKNKDKKVLISFDKKEFAEIEDHRGIKYIEKGKIKEVLKLGELPGKILLENTTPEDYEKMRIENLTLEEKQKEIDQINEGLLDQSATMKSKLEIEGDSKALKKAQDWYKLEKEKIQKKYGSISSSV